MNINIEQKIQELINQRNLIDSQINLLRSMLVPGPATSSPLDHPAPITTATPAILPYSVQSTAQVQQPVFRQDAIATHQALKTPPDQMVVHGGTYKGKPAKYVEEYIGSKPRDYYGGADKEIT